MLAGAGFLEAFSTLTACTIFLTGALMTFLMASLLRRTDGSVWDAVNFRDVPESLGQALVPWS